MAGKERVDSSYSFNDIKKPKKHMHLFSLAMILFMTIIISHPIHALPCNLDDQYCVSYGSCPTGTFFGYFPAKYYITNDAGALVFTDPSTVSHRDKNGIITPIGRPDPSTNQIVVGDSIRISEPSTTNTGTDILGCQTGRIPTIRGSVTGYSTWVSPILNCAASQNWGISRGETISFTRLASVGYDGIAFLNTIGIGTGTIQWFLVDTPYLNSFTDAPLGTGWCSRNVEYICADRDSDGEFDERCGISGQNDCDDFDSRIHMGATEVCDGVDNDCNPATAEGSGEITPLNDNQKGVCLNSNKICSGGWVNNYADPPIAGYEDPESTCDGLDNDCDGTIDEGTNICGAGNSCVGGACCAPTSTCALTSCVNGQLKTKPTLCDGSCDNTKGFIIDVTTAIDADNDGNDAVCGDCNDNDATIGTNKQEICDNIDNDCDGTIDESITTACFEGIPPATAGVGICVSGIATCAAGVFGACTGQVLPIAEICNNIDDDCDGAIDDGCDDDDDDHCDAAMSKQEGLTITVCSDTPASDTEGDDCDDTAAAIHPASTEASTAECTDRKDNDCDALTDCMDSGCAANAACKEQNCADGLDNEGDGKADSYDSADCPACTISDARWTSDLPGNLDIDQRRDGQTAYLVVDGQNCYHRVVDYDLWEQDFLATQFWDDDVWDPFSSPATFLVNTGTLAIPWSAVYDQFSIGSQDSSESGNPEYYFIATVRDSTEDSQSGTLEVTPDTLICPADADNDGYNIAGGGTDCGPIDCDDTEAAINPGKLEICNGIDDDCDGSIDEGGVCAVCVKNPASPDTEICNNLIDDDCNLAIDCDDPYCYTFAGCVAPENCVDLDLVVDANNNYDVQLDTTLCKKRYVLPDTDHSAKEGVLNIIANNIFLDCNEAQLVGDGLGTAIKALDRTGITIRRCNLTNYDNGIKATNSINSWFTENLLSTKHDLLFDASSAGNRMRLNHFYTSGVSDSSSNANFYCPDVGGTPRGNLYNVSIPWGKIGWNDCGPSIFTLPLPDAVITDTINPIQFEWTLQSALTPLGYFLEYSLNGGAWKKIDNLPLGTARTYSWTPPGNLPGLYEIRLKPYEGTTGTGPDYDSWVNATQNITRITYAETATVSGDVTCAQNGNEAVAGATVNITIINADDTETNIWAVTDQYGHYIIYNAPTGSREITANYPGMTRGRKTVEIVSPSTPVEFNTVCPFTLDCETDCTLVNNGVCMPECDGFKSGEEECNIQSLCIGHTKDFTMTNPLDTSQSITCCESMNTLEQGEKAKIEVNADNIATITRIVYYNNKPVRMAVVSWN
ncbi:MAG TPA: MopE-related protein [Candidatus Nanoarchaeia archaeon]|nr:MopE-related protein [Candidatus Nanoarchaeia archaeon]